MSCAGRKKNRESNEYDFPQEQESPKKLKQLNKDRPKQSKKRPPSRQKPQSSYENEDDDEYEDFLPPSSSTFKRSRKAVKSKKLSRKQEQSTRRFYESEEIDDTMAKVNQAISFLDFIFLFRNQIIQVATLILNIFI